MECHRLSLPSFLSSKRPSSTPRLLFSHGVFTVDGPMMVILCSLFVMFCAIEGLLLVPEVRTILSAALLAEIAIILAVLGKSRFVLSVSSVYKGIVLAQTLIYGAVIGTEIVETIKTLPNRLLINASPDSINRLVTVNLWFIIVVYLLVILFTYLHFTSLIATIQRIDDEINSSQDNSLPLYATLESAKSPMRKKI